MQTTVANYLSAFKSIKGVCAGVGVTIPALSFFTHYAPPLFEAASLLTSAIAGAVVMLTYYYEPHAVSPDTDKQKLIRFARNALIAAVALLVVYMVMLKICTVEDPPEKPEVRYQIGFWTFDWSLNDDGRYLKQRHPDATPRELMEYGVAFSKDGPAKIWSFGSILTSGISMVLIFLFTFVLWVFGWSLLAKRKALDPQPNQAEVDIPAPASARSADEPI